MYTVHKRHTTDSKTQIGGKTEKGVHEKSNQKRVGVAMLRTGQPQCPMSKKVIELVIRIISKEKISGPYGFAGKFCLSFKK